jgi:hypothetical protein
VIADKSKYNIEPLGDHDRAAFSCGDASLDRYIREQASQDVKRGLASVFVITAKDDPKQILAYYTLSSGELKLDQLPEEIAKKAGKYGHVGSDSSWKDGGRGEMQGNGPWCTDTDERPS